MVARDAVGVKDRKYLDHTGLQRQSSIAELMRYAAMNRGRFDGADALANHNGQSELASNATWVLRGRELHKGSEM